MHYGFFEYTVLPLGLHNAPSTFQHLLNSVMHGYIDDFVLVYLDYILVFSNTEDEHESHLHKVLDRLFKHKIEAKLKKYEFGKTHVKYLGLMVGSDKLSVDCDKVAAVTDQQPPTNVKGM